MALQIHTLNSSAKQMRLLRVKKLRSCTVVACCATEIGDHLGVTLSTVRAHATICEKLHVQTVLKFLGW
jgi:hypothetical protein